MNERWEEVDERVITPDSYVVSVRLNREELHVLTDAARFYGKKLSTYIKEQAMREASRPQVKYEVSA